MFNRLDGSDQPNPVRRSFVPREPEPEPRGLSYETVREILDQMPERGQALKGQARDNASKTKARLAVMAYTGLPPASIMRLRPKDVRWESGSVFVQGRRKGRGTRGRTMPLTSKGLEALKRFDELDCWGSFSTSSMWKSFQRAAAKADVEGVRPYDLRHSFGSAIYATTGDLSAAQSLLGHSSSRMTERYTLAAVPERLRAAIGQLEIAQTPLDVVAASGGSRGPIPVNSSKQSTRP